MSANTRLGLVAGALAALTCACGPHPPQAAQCTASRDSQSSGNVVVQCEGYYVISQHGMQSTPPGTAVTVPMGRLVGLFAAADWGKYHHPYLWLPAPGSTVTPSDALTKQSVSDRFVQEAAKHYYVDTLRDNASGSFIGVDVTESLDMDNTNVDYHFENTKFRVDVVEAKAADGTVLFKAPLWTSGSIWSYASGLFYNLMHKMAPPTPTNPGTADEQAPAANVCGGNVTLYGFGGGLIFPGALDHIPEIQAAMAQDSHLFLVTQALDTIDIGLTVMLDVMPVADTGTKLKNVIAYSSGGPEAVGLLGLDSAIDCLASQYLLTGTIDWSQFQMGLLQDVDNFLSQLMFCAPMSAICTAISLGTLTIPGPGWVANLGADLICNYPGTIERVAREAYDSVTTDMYQTLSSPLLPATCAAGAGGACPMGTSVCGSVCTNTQVDAASCGACGTACAAGQICSSGMCCASGQTACNGTCVDTATDSRNCGACGTACGAGMFCSSGACAMSCDPPNTVCGSGGSQVCTDLRTDSANCGACGNPCPFAEVCSAGMCCSAGETSCGGVCVDPQHDNNNCGGCGIACAAGASCANGACQASCLSPNVPCGTGSAAVCTNMAMDPANCGACGNACPAGSTCSGGACVSGCPTKPLWAWDASPMPGNVCNIGNILVTDGNVAGLDSMSDAAISPVDGIGETGCIAVDFGAVYPFKTVNIVAEPSGNACGFTPCGGGNCGKFDQMDVFYDDTTGGYKYLTSVSLTGTSLASYPVTLTKPTRFIIVCRPSWTDTFDDVSVDSVTASCM